MTLAFLQSSVRFASGPLACLLLAILVGLANAQTPTRLDAIVEAGALRVGLTEDYRPFSFADASSKVEGIDVDMAMSLAQSLGVRLEIVKTSWPTSNPTWRRTASTLRWVGSPSPSTDKKRDCSPTPSFQAARRRSRIAETNRNTERSRRSISPACTSSSIREEPTSALTGAHLQKATIVPWSDNATIFDALIEGKADLMITDAVETRVQAKLHPGVLCPVHPSAPFDHSELA